MAKNEGSRISLEEVLRKIVKTPLDAIASFLLRIKMQPNHITLLGLLGSIAAGVLIAFGHLLWAGLLAALMAPLDAVDGAMARLKGNPTIFGSFFDSVIDRYDELFLLAGLTFHFIQQANTWGVMLTFGAAAGSVLVSYTRAKAEALGLNAKVGFMTRIERSIVLIIGLLVGKPLVSVGIIAILANITAIQRIASVWQQSKVE